MLIGFDITQLNWWSMSVTVNLQTHGQILLRFLFFVVVVVVNFEAYPDVFDSKQDRDISVEIQQYNKLQFRISFR